MIFPQEEYNKRIHNCKHLMKDQKIDTILVYSDFMRQYNVRYLTGYLYFPSPMSVSILILPLDSNPILLVDNISSRALDRIRRDSWIKDIRTAKVWLKKPWISGVLEFIKELTIKTLVEEKISTKHIGIAGYDFLPHILFEELKKQFTDSTFIDVTDSLDRMRMIKSDLEIDMIRKTAGIADEGLHMFMNVIDIGKREHEIGAEMFKAIYAAGIEEIQGFWVRSGPVNTQYHGTPRFTTRKIHDGDLAWTDMGFSCNGYFADTARSTIVGKRTKKNTNLCDACLAALEGAIDAMEPGITVAEAFEASVNKARKAGFEKYFRVGFWGHGVGVNMDEYPIFAPQEQTILKSNMTLSIGPRFSVPDFGGVTIEENIRITEKGVEHLNKFDTKLW